MMNLYLYLPSNSAHPPGALKGLIYGNMLRYWKQNTFRSDFINIITLFLQLLMSRGYTFETLEKYFIEASRHIHLKVNKPSPTVELPINNTSTKGNDTLFLHTENHPRDLSRNIIRKLYDKHLRDIYGFEKFIICYSRPKNLRDSLIHTRLEDISGSRATDILKSIL